MVTADPEMPEAPRDGSPLAGVLRSGLSGLLKIARQIGVYFGLLAAAGGGLVLIGKAMRMIGLSANATHIARFAMIGLYLAAAVAMAKGKR